jgi:hypothetical protein
MDKVEIIKSDTESL